MTLALYSTGINFSATGSAFARSSGRKRLFARLIEALHRSRRIQAERIITQSSHLLQDTAATERRAEKK